MRGRRGGGEGRWRGRRHRGRARVVIVDEGHGVARRVSDAVVQPELDDEGVVAVGEGRRRAARLEHIDEGGGRGGVAEPADERGAVGALGRDVLARDRHEIAAVEAGRLRGEVSGGHWDEQGR